MERSIEDVSVEGIHTAAGSHSATSLDLTVVRLDSDWETIGNESLQNPIHQVESDNLAYVIFTSGSTGIPKAAMIQHGSLLNYTLMASSEYAIQPGDRVLQFASIGFDASAEEIYPCLTRGATLVLRTDAMLGADPWSRPGECARQLFRPRWTFTAGYPGHVTGGSHFPSKIATPPPF